MDSDSVKKIMRLNLEFYSDQAEQFNITRNTFWAGWLKLEKYIVANQKNLSILDLGCGNGRFYQFLQSSLSPQNINFQYLGIDQSNELLDIARNKSTPIPNHTFKNISLLKYNLSELITGKFDFIAMIALLHHLPGKNNRLKFLSKIAGLLKENGFLVITLWRFLDCTQQRKKILKTENWSKIIEIQPEQLEPNDYFLSWQNKQNIRYCHYFDNDEIKKIKTNLAGFSLKLTEQFQADGKSCNLNEYLVFKKINS